MSELENILVKSRPNFGPRQVRTVEGVKPGNILTEVNLCGNGSETRILIISEPHPKTVAKGEEPPIRYDYLVLSGCMKGWIDGSYAEDMSINPNLPGNVWNTKNYVLRTGRKRLTEGQIALKISKLFTKDCIDCRRL